MEECGQNFLEKASSLLFMGTRGDSETVPHSDDSKYTTYTRDTAGLRHKTQAKLGSVTWAAQRNYLGSRSSSAT